MDLIRNYFNTFNIIILVETFIEDKYIERTEKRLPKGYKWHWTPAVRDHCGGRPFGGLVIGVKKGIQSDNYWNNKRSCICGIDVSINQVEFHITGVYCREGV